MATAKSEGNLNNHVGLPLSLLRLDETARVAVIEMGMNHAGEIRELAAIAKPQVGVVTNVGYAHIENFESIEDIAAAKRELIEALPPIGTAVLNADDPRVARVHASRAARFSMGNRLRPRFAPRTSSIRWRACDFAWVRRNFESALTGPPQRFESFWRGSRWRDCTASRRIAWSDTVRKLLPGKMRGERFHHRGILVYNDCYNSNPDAVRAMLDVLARHSGAAADRGSGGDARTWPLGRALASRRRHLRRGAGD